MNTINHLPHVFSALSEQEIGNKAPEGVAYPKSIKSFVRRTGRTTSGQLKAREELGPVFIKPYQTELIDPDYPFQKNSNKTATSTLKPLILEIGFGMGEATAHIAAIMPDVNFLCCEVYEAGVGSLLKKIDEQNLTNIRIIPHDAVEVIEHMLPEKSLSGIHIFFPDPWHKKKHNKRRLIQTPFVHKLSQRLGIGGYLHCATDWQPYAEQILEVLGKEPMLENNSTRSTPELKGFAPKPYYRPLTKFENRGIKLGHGVWDVIFTRK